MSATIIILSIMIFITTATTAPALCVIILMALLGSALCERHYFTTNSISYYNVYDVAISVIVTELILLVVYYICK